MMWRITFNTVDVSGTLMTTSLYLGCERGAEMIGQKAFSEADSRMDECT